MLTRKEIMEIIPHRDPFLLIDEVSEMDMDALIVRGRKVVREDEYYFPGHFPGNPVMPGVIMVETMAQLGGVLILSLPAFKGKTAYFASLDGVRFRRKIRPGETADIEVAIQKIKGPVVVGQGKLSVGGELACEGKIKTVIA